MTFSNRKLSSLGALLALGSGIALQAQIQTGNLVVTVKSDSGKAVVGAIVRLRSERMIGDRTGATDGNGVFRAAFLPPGHYTATVTKDGFLAQGLSAVVSLGGTSDSSITLKPVAAAGATVVVTAAASSKLDSAAVVPQENFTSDEIMNALPVLRTPDQIAFLAPGVTASAGNAKTATPTFAGAASYENKYMVNGVDVNDPYFNTPNNLFIEDAIEETAVIQNGVSAEYGRFTGGVINAITKSGGNDFTGSLRAMLKNSEWNALLPAQDKTQIPNSLQKTYVGTMGGPILKDKLWFFVAVRSVDTNAAETLPLTSLPYTLGTKEFRYETKLTWAINDNNTLAASTTQFNSTRQTYPPLGSMTITPDGLTNRKDTQALYVMDLRSIIGSNMTLDVKGSMKKSEGTLTAPNSNPAFANSPVYDLNNGVMENNAYFGNTPDRRDNQELAAVFTWVVEGAGTHELKFGLSRFQEINTTDNSQSVTGVVINSSDSGMNYPGTTYTFLNESDAAAQGLPYAYIQVYNAQVTKFVSTYDAFFVNDAWRISPQWNVGLGARVERFSATSSTLREVSS